jgi:hypothetical protein
MKLLEKKGVFRSAEMACVDGRTARRRRGTKNIVCFQLVMDENPPLALVRQNAAPSEHRRPLGSAVGKTRRRPTVGFGPPKRDRLRGLPDASRLGVGAVDMTADFLVVEIVL